MPEMPVATSRSQELPPSVHDQKASLEACETASQGAFEVCASPEYADADQQRCEGIVPVRATAEG